MPSPAEDSTGKLLSKRGSQGRNPETEPRSGKTDAYLNMLANHSVTPVVWPFTIEFATKKP